MRPTTLLSFALAAGVSKAQSLTEVIAQNSDLSQLGSLLNQYPDVASKLAGLSNVTLLAPNNAAVSSLMGDAALAASFASDQGLIASVLLYHVITGVVRSTDITTTATFPKTLLTNATLTKVSGGQVVKAQVTDGAVKFTSGLLSTSGVVTADVTFNGGILHVIDKVLTIPQADSITAAAANLTALAGALASANLVSTVDGASDVTIFAPTNEAFAALQGNAASVSPEQISSVLSYHVVQGTVGYSTTLVNGAQLTTLQGGQVTITISNGRVFVNSAAVSVTDVLVSNGVAHVIDSLLIPGTGPTGTVTPTYPTVTPAANATATNPPVTAGVPMQTAAVGAAALFGGAAALAMW